MLLYNAKLRKYPSNTTKEVNFNEQQLIFIKEKSPAGRTELMK